MRTGNVKGSPATRLFRPAGVSNRKLTTASARRRLTDQLNGGLRDLVKRCENLGVGLVTLLSDDHV
jgi:hypothetical protein